jgi:hypothetical protein
VRAERAREEMDALVDQLTAAYGLGGRSRPPGTPGRRPAAPSPGGSAPPSAASRRCIRLWPSISPATSALAASASTTPRRPSPGRCPQPGEASASHREAPPHASGVNRQPQKEVATCDTLHAPWWRRQPWP